MSKQGEGRTRRSLCLPSDGVHRPDGSIRSLFAANDFIGKFAKQLQAQARQAGLPGGGGGAGPNGQLPKPGGAGALAVIAAGGLAVLGYSSMYNVDGGHRAIIYNRSVVPSPAVPRALR